MAFAAETLRTTHKRVATSATKTVGRPRRPEETQQSVETGGKLTMLLGFMLPLPTPLFPPYGLLILGDIPEIGQGSNNKKQLAGESG